MACSAPASSEEAMGSLPLSREELYPPKARHTKGIQMGAHGAMRFRAFGLLALRLSLRSQLIRGGWKRGTHRIHHRCLAQQRPRSRRGRDGPTSTWQPAIVTQRNRSLAAHAEKVTRTATRRRCRTPGPNCVKRVAGRDPAARPLRAKIRRSKICTVVRITSWCGTSRSRSSSRPRSCCPNR